MIRRSRRLRQIIDLRDNGDPEVNVFTETVQDCLDAEMKCFPALGDGSKVKEAQALSEDEENTLCNFGLLGDSSPGVRLDTMVFLIGRNFSLPSGKEHRNLKCSQLTLEPANCSMYVLDSSFLMIVSFKGN